MRGERRGRGVCEGGRGEEEKEGGNPLLEG